MTLASHNSWIVLLMIDVLVLGAGPAGVAVSLLLARRGYSVEVVDPAFFPRKKICGEFLNPQAVRWIDEQQILPSLLQIEPYPVYGMKLFNSKGESFTGRYQSDRKVEGYAVMRAAFDSLLLSRARSEGILIHEGYSAARLICSRDEIAVAGIGADGVPFEKKAKVVIGADGRNNLVGRTFGWVRSIRKLKKYAFQAYMENVPDLDHFGEVHLVRDGYVGIAPLSDTLANIALVVDESAHPGGETSPSEFLSARLLESSLAERLAGLPFSSNVMTAGPLAFETVRVSGNRTLLVGDTCGFIDPFTGEGINYAFVGAELAANVLDFAFQNNAFDDRTLAMYDERRRKAFSRKWTMSRLLQLAIEKQSIGEVLIRKFSQKPELADTMVSVVGSAVPVDRVWNFQFLLKLAF